MAKKRKTKNPTRTERLRKNREMEVRKQQIQEEIEAVEDEDEFLEELDIQDDNAVESVDEIENKDYHDGSTMDMYAGPTSWNELDEMKKLREQQDQIREETWNVQDLVSNIVRNPVMSPEKKGQAISEVGSGFSKRISMVATKEAKPEYDIELLEVEAILAKEYRSLSFLERIGTWIEKKKLTYSAEEALSDSDFALVVTRDGKKVRKYPIHDKAHVRNALARAAQQIKAGGQGASDARAALPKIRAAAKKLGIGSSEKSTSGIMVEKDASGTWRAVMWPSNNFIDRDNDIITEKAHREYVDWVNENMDYAPVFLSWHTPETARKNRVDFVNYDNGFLMMSAPLEEAEAAVILKAQAVCDLGMSHGSIVLGRNQADPRLIEHYIMIEVSDLPVDNAANPFTDLSVISKEADMDKLQYLTEMFGEEKAKSLLAKTEQKQKFLREEGIEEKEVTPDPDAVETKPEPQAQTASITEILEAVSKELDIEGLDAFVQEARTAIEKVGILEELVKELSQNQDDVLADKIAPPIEKKHSWSRPSNDNANVLKKDGKEDQELQSSVHEVHWLAQLAENSA